MPIDLLCVCTGNQCRSPMAEVLLRRRLDDVGVAATVSSTGLLRPGRPAAPGAVAAMAERGLDLSGHRSRVLDAGQLAAADIVVAMAREHVREAWLIDRSVLERTFTFKELVRRGEAAGADAAADLPGWLGRLGAGRRAADLVGEAPDDDVEDPIGRPAAAFERVAAELDGLAARLAALLAGVGRGAAPGAPAREGATR